MKGGGLGEEGEDQEEKGRCLMLRRAAWRNPPTSTSPLCVDGIWIHSASLHWHHPEPHMVCILLIDHFWTGQIYSLSINNNEVGHMNYIQQQSGDDCILKCFLAFHSAISTTGGTCKYQILRNIIKGMSHLSHLDIFFPSLIDHFMIFRDCFYFGMWPPVKHNEWKLNSFPTLI